MSTEKDYEQYAQQLQQYPVLVLGGDDQEIADYIDQRRSRDPEKTEADTKAGKYYGLTGEWENIRGMKFQGVTILPNARKNRFYRSWLAGIGTLGVGNLSVPVAFFRDDFNFHSSRPSRTFMGSLSREEMEEKADAISMAGIRLPESAYLTFRVEEDEFENLCRVENITYYRPEAIEFTSKTGVKVIVRPKGDRSRF